MDKLLDDLIKQLRLMLEINDSQKRRLLDFVMTHMNYDPIFRHDVLHHCCVVEKMPERYSDENDFDYKTRLLQCKRRMDEQNRLGGCLLIAIDMIENLKKQS